MIHFFSVGKFVYYNIIQDFFRGEDQPPVEVQVSFAGAASPAGFLFPDRDTAVGYAHFSGVGCGFSFEYFSGGFHIITAAEFRKRRVFSLGLCRPGGGVGKVLQDPAFFLGEKTMDGNKISVIIADDNKEFCSILNDYLLNQKDIVVTGIAKDGKEALTLIEEKKPDLVVLDIIICLLYTSPSPRDS